MSPTSDMGIAGDGVRYEQLEAGVVRIVLDRPESRNAQDKAMLYALNEAFVRFKELADKKKLVYDDDIVALVDDALAHGQDRIQVKYLRVVAGTEGPQEADLVLEIDGVETKASAKGDGPVDAVFNAVRQAAPHDATLRLFQVHAVTEGTDAQAQVSVRLEDGSSIATGQGADTDTLVAAAKAYVGALNNLMARKQKSAPGPLLASGF